jgi:hypothetical protein
VIRYDLVCDRSHAFDSWFPSSDAYDKQAKRGLVNCPICGSQKVEKAIMAPRLARTDKRSRNPDRPNQAPGTPEDTAPVAMMSPQEREFRAKLKELHDHVVKNADNVGKKFPEEARRMHYGETDPRSIYGEASLEDAAALAEEGIEFHHLPRPPEDRN